ncbi:uncharacterized protein LOC127776574 [Oryza glaberrima]|uniref:uncharacterized protein LOC127776574 n=1 Tax=Oryza glaberrima TaxID=4538 RepID=UPI00224C1E22|nr:uncharacterized protein LOC127776574 [Oryza glaberrima]
MGLLQQGCPWRRARPENGAASDGGSRGDASFPQAAHGLGAAGSASSAAARNGSSSSSLLSRRLRRSSAVEMRREWERRPLCGEVAGGTAAECAAVFCCFPFTVVELVVLAAVRVPTAPFEVALPPRPLSLVVVGGSERKQSKAGEAKRRRGEAQGPYAAALKVAHLAPDELACLMLHHCSMGAAAIPSSFPSIAW